LSVDAVQERPTNPKEGAVAVRLVGAVGGVVSTTTAKGAPLLAIPPTVTTTFPVVAPVGTGTTICVLFQAVGEAGVPLKVTELGPANCVAPKVVPAIVTDVPTEPVLGFKLEMFGKTVNGTPLLATPPTVTTTLPVVLDAIGTTALMLPVDHELMVAVALLIVRLLEPCEVPKPLPVTVTAVPAAPVEGLTPVIAGDGGLTVKFTTLLEIPSPRTMTTGPEVAPVGTAATMLVALQLVGVVATPLNPTMLVPCEAPKPVPEIVTK
jgi:hypothetical protein